MHIIRYGAHKVGSGESSASAGGALALHSTNYLTSTFLFLATDHFRLATITQQCSTIMVTSLRKKPDLVIFGSYLDFVLLLVIAQYNF